MNLQNYPNEELIELCILESNATLFFTKLYFDLGNNFLIK